MMIILFFYAPAVNYVFVEIRSYKNILVTFLRLRIGNIYDTYKVLVHLIIVKAIGYL